MLKPTLQKSEHFQSTIALVYPNGGETVPQRSRQTIQWKVGGTAPAIRIVLLRYGKLFQTIVEEYPGAKGTIVWTVGKVQAGDGYTIRLTSVNNDLGEIEYTQDDNTYQTEVVNASNYWGQ